MGGAETEQFLNKNGGLVKGKTLGDAFTRYANEISPTIKGEWRARKDAD